MSGPRLVAMDDGCRIACDYRPRDGAPVVVLSPSLGTSMQLFAPQMERLSQRFGVLRYAPRGHGASDVPLGDYSLDRLGRDVIGLFDALAIDQAHFAGVSLGGMTGQWLGYREPGRLLTLTLANTSAFMGPASAWAERIGNVRTNGMMPMIDPVIERWFTPKFRMRDPVRVEDIAAMLRGTDPAGYAGCCAAIRDMDLRPTARLISVPTLIIAGTKDPATPAAHAKFLAWEIPGSRLTELEAAHLSNVELPEQFTAHLMEFLEAQ